MKYNILLFDADETLFDFKLSEKVAFSKTMHDFNIAYDEKYHHPIYDQINSAIWKEFEMGKITQEVLKIERFRRLSETLNLNFNPSDFAKKFMGHLSEASYIYPDAQRLLQHLSTNFKLGIITNGLYEVQKKRIGKSDISKYFEVIIISEKVGLAKPDQAIFKLTLEEMQANDTKKVLMIGDSLTSDIQGGINAGIDTCWFNSLKKTNKSAIVPTHEIHSLMDLLTVLEQE